MGRERAAWYRGPIWTHPTVHSDKWGASPEYGFSAAPARARAVEMARNGRYLWEMVETDFAVLMGRLTAPHSPPGHVDVSKKIEKSQQLVLGGLILNLNSRGF